MNKLTLIGPVCRHDGYGTIVVSLARELIDLGVDLALQSTVQPDPRNVDPDVMACLDVRRRDDCELLLNVPWVAGLMKAPFKLMYAMFESNKIRRDWVYSLNSATINLVPAQWCREVWRANGVEDPIEVVPLGVNSKFFSYRERQIKDTFTFLISGTLQRRKNPLIVAQAFLEEFDEPDVRLVIKTLPHMGITLVSPDPRIQIISDRWSSEQMRDLMYSCDCFVYPSSGEGFGLPPLEAMSTGIPVILSSCTGMLEFCDDKYCFPLPMFGTETQILWTGSEGDVFVPCYRSLKSLMRLVYENREMANEMGERASSWVSSNFTWRKTASNLLRIINDSNIILSNGDE